VPAASQELSILGSIDKEAAFAIVARHISFKLFLGSLLQQ
jgi:hypothetical protein